ncbi:hypothetical protein Scep_010921 [Stephania cephalantha]|uniref:Uncharacterized protein n=1 Tax=Stephania cephalantha TaxID=152367 RepID=A0AAP0JYB8_9MAGN
MVHLIRTSCGDKHFNNIELVARAWSVVHLIRFLVATLRLKYAELVVGARDFDVAHCNKKQCKYQDDYIHRLKAKYFSKKTLYGVLTLTFLPVLYTAFESCAEDFRLMQEGRTINDGGRALGHSQIQFRALKIIASRQIQRQKLPTIFVTENTSVKKAAISKACDPIQNQVERTSECDEPKSMNLAFVIDSRVTGLSFVSRELVIQRCKGILSLQGLQVYEFVSQGYIMKCSARFRQIVLFHTTEVIIVSIRTSECGEPKSMNLAIVIDSRVTRVS